MRRFLHYGERQRDNPMNIYEKEKDEKEFEDQLNEIYGEVEICGMKFDSGYVLKELDPTAFRCALSDEPIVYIC